MNFQNQLNSSIVRCLGGFLLVALSACGTPRDGSFTTHVSAKRITGSNLPAPEKAEELAKGAEELLTAQGFSQASELADLALKQDPENLRAGLVKALTGPLILQRGLAARVRPLARTNARYEEALDKQLEAIKGTSEAHAAYLSETGAGAAITSESELQAHLDAMIESLESLRRFAKANRNSEITVRATSLLVPDIVDRYANACEIKTTEKFEYELVCPAETTRFFLTMNRADFEAISAMAGYVKTYFVLSSAYDISGGLEKAAPWITMKSLDPHAAIGVLMREPAFGRLREQNRLLSIKDMGVDLVTALNWGNSHQDTLCPKGSSGPQNRVGAWLNTGLCLGPFVTPYINTLDTFLRGDEMPLHIAAGGTIQVVQHKGLKFFVEPIQNLRTLTPLKLTGCKTLQSVGDTTLGGILPGGELNQLLLLEANHSCPQGVSP